MVIYPAIISRLVVPDSENHLLFWKVTLSESARRTGREKQPVIGKMGAAETRLALHTADKYR
jgi:hypothetical protein